MVLDSNVSTHQSRVLESKSPLATKFSCSMKYHFGNLLILLFHRALVLAMIISLIFIVLLRFLAGIMVWVMIVLVILVIGYGKASPPLQP